MPLQLSQHRSLFSVTESVAFNLARYSFRRHFPLVIMSGVWLTFMRQWTPYDQLCYSHFWMFALHCSTVLTSCYRVVIISSMHVVYVRVQPSDAFGVMPFRQCSVFCRRRRHLQPKLRRCCSAVHHQSETRFNQIRCSQRGCQCWCHATGRHAQLFLVWPARSLLLIVRRLSRP